MEKRIIEEIRRAVRESPDNRFPGGKGAYFDDPLVGFASAADPLFRDYKTIIGEFHLAPAEIYEKAFGVPMSGGSVICWVLPVSLRARESNRQEVEWPSPDWARTRTHGEAFNDALRGRVVAFLERQGARAVAPVLSGAWEQFDSTPVGIASSWSERHAAYAAGLGTFGLSDGLITEKGIAHRCGSVITDLSLAPSPRRFADRTANCLFLRGGSCGLCIARCPAGAVTPAGHNKEMCRHYLHETMPSAVGRKYDVKVLGCGLCQTDVPCEDRIPLDDAGGP